MARYRTFRELDWSLLLVTLAVCGLGVLQIFSATHDTVWHDAWWKQIIYIAAGLIGMWLMTRVDYHILMGHVPVLYGVTIVTLVGVSLVGVKVFGSRRW